MSAAVRGDGGARGDEGIASLVGSRSAAVPIKDDLRSRVHCDSTEKLVVDFCGKGQGGRWQARTVDEGDGGAAPILSRFKSAMIVRRNSRISLFRGQIKKGSLGILR